MDFHIPVLLEPTIDSLNIIPGGVYVDATLGHGGHTLAMLKKGAKVYAFEQDINNIKIAKDRIEAENLSKNFFPINSNFKNIKKELEKLNIQKIDGLIADLGLSFDQQSKPGRGFSFNDDVSLDMRLNPETQTVTAENIINTSDFEALYQLFTKYAQEHYSKPIILRVIRARQKMPLRTGKELADIIRKYYKDHHIKSHLDPATKVFMALRIAVNDEYKNIEKLLDDSLDLVKENGTVSIITFHSGEDRIVKQFIKQQIALDKVSKTNHIKPSFNETKNNPLSRSSILRSYTIK